MFTNWEMERTEGGSLLFLTDEMIFLTGEKAASV